MICGDVPACLSCASFPPAQSAAAGEPCSPNAQPGEKATAGCQRRNNTHIGGCVVDQPQHRTARRRHSAKGLNRRRSLSSRAPPRWAAAAPTAPTARLPTTRHGASSVVSGFVASFARPGGNITGFVVAEGALGGKWVDLLKERYGPGAGRRRLCPWPWRCA
jgi:hypothetical protein